MVHGSGSSGLDALQFLLCHLTAHLLSYSIDLPIQLNCVLLKCHKCISFWLKCYTFWMEHSKITYKGHASSTEIHGFSFGNFIHIYVTLYELISCDHLLLCHRHHQICLYTIISQVDKVFLAPQVFLCSTWQRIYST